MYKALENHYLVTRLKVKATEKLWNRMRIWKTMN